jgi:hypothetical protein
MYDVFCGRRVSDQLESLSQLSAAWQALECQLAELQVALRSDQQTLRLLDSALREGAGAQDVVSSIKDVAKVLSERQDLRVQVRNPSIGLWNRPLQ